MPVTLEHLVSVHDQCLAELRDILRTAPDGVASDLIGRCCDMIQSGDPETGMVGLLGTLGLVQVLASLREEEKAG